MERREVLAAIENIVDEVKTAIFATVDGEGKPCMRWVTPAVLRGRTGALYFITYPGSEKVRQIAANPNAQWIFQTRALDRIIAVDGKVNVLDNPSIRSEVLEVVGPRLAAFWKINLDERDLLVIETIIEKVVFYRPMKGERETVVFGRG
jgi:pyridoxamine 5'-phosphate oxidase